MKSNHFSILFFYLTVDYLLETSHIIILALVQGITEFLPISSSAHLILLPQIAGWTDQGLAFDIALHVGTLSAVLMYFRHELRPLFHSWTTSIATRQLTAESRLVWGVAIATIPVGIAGLTVTHFGWEDSLRSPLLIACTTIGYGLLLGWADIRGSKQRDEYTLTWRDITIIGLAQALALVPGTSRSGITMTAALFLGLHSKGAVRFSFLLSIPVIILAGIDETTHLVMQDTVILWIPLLLAVIFSALSAYLCIYAFLGILNKMGMMPFVVYRIGLGIALLFWGL